MAKRLTPVTLSIKPPRRGRVEIRDSDSPLVFRVTSAGARSLTIRTRLHGNQIRLTYSRAAIVENLGDARNWAHDVRDKCRHGIDPRRELQDQSARSDQLRFENVVEEFMRRHASKNKTANETRRIFERYVLPEWRSRAIPDITRRDVNDLLDKIEDCKIDGPKGHKIGGPVMADRVLAAIRTLFNWCAIRDESISSPIVRGMARTRPKDRARTRVLNDDEIRAFWKVAGGLGTYGSLVKTLLLTGQRRDEVGRMSRSEMNDEWVWTIPAERYKTGMPNQLTLPHAVREIIKGQAVIDDSDLIFTTNGQSPFSGFSKSKSLLDREMIATMAAEAADKGEDPEKVELPHWTLHDLRRTAKTLMARAGLRPDISERVLGHVIPGVEGVYDRHSYKNEKRDALEKLSTIINSILQPEQKNVIRLERGKV